MAETTFKYADQDNLRQYFADYGSLIARQRIYDWTNSTPNIWIATGFGTKPADVFFDGTEGTEVSGTPANSREWKYVSATDTLTVYSTTDPNDARRIHVGENKDDYVDQMLVNASMKLSSMLDSKFPRPLPKSFIHSDAPSTDEPEYDAVVIEATCLLALYLMARSKGRWDMADQFMAGVTNQDETGIVDKLNAGVWKLGWQIDSQDARGRIIEHTRTGSMHLVATYGRWTGQLYDRIQVLCTTGGGYGTAKITVKTSGDEQLYGTSQTDITVTGNIQALAGGVYGRFEGDRMSAGDRWDVEVHHKDIQEDVPYIKSYDVKLR